MIMSGNTRVRTQRRISGIGNWRTILMGIICLTAKMGHRFENHGCGGMLIN